MTRLFAAGAEAGTTDVFGAIVGAFAVSAVQKRTGAYSFYCPPDNTWPRATVTLSADKTVLYFRIGIYPISILAAYGDFPAALVQLYDNVGALQCCLGIDENTRLLKVTRGGYDGPVLATSIHAVPLNAWSCIEWHIKIDDGTDGETIVKLDGTTEISDLDLDTKATAVAGARIFSLGGPYSYIQGYYDDIAVNDTAGAVNNSWIGRGGIYGIVPEGVGTYTDLIASAGNAWDCIEEVPPSDADYVYESTVDKKSTYAMTALTPTTGTIACINVIMRAKLDAVGTGNIARLIRSNGVDSQGADVGLDASPKTIQENIETDPSGGGAWTIARVNALEAGAVVR